MLMLLCNAVSVFKLSVLYKTLVADESGFLALLYKIFV